MTALPAEREMNASVDVKSFLDLFDDPDYPMALDAYQRPYVWGEDKVKQLADDLSEHLNSRSEGRHHDYYMGTLLLHLHHDRQRRFIIDGQQRLTSLSVLHYVVTGELPGSQELRYSPESVANIRKARETFAKSDLQKNAADLFKYIRFTVITVLSEDLAFTFFDTQNNRAVPLAATDLLKAFHLRAIRGEYRDMLQTECASRWETMQRERQILGHGGDFAPTLFNQFLWRSRRWTGQKYIARESYNQIIEEFQGKSIEAESAESVPLYPGHNNCRATEISLLPDGSYSLTESPPFSGKQSDLLPFAIRQPISQGLGFFLYADKYASLTEKLLDEESTDPQIQEFVRFYRDVVEILSPYLRELFLLGCVMFADQFGTGRLFGFALWFDHVLGAIRFDKHYIFREAPLIYLRDSSNNILDVIAGSFRPEQAIEHLKQDMMAKAVYASNKTAEIVMGEGVQGKYKQRLLKYFDKQNADFSEKARWIEERLK